tara:strand:- start:962 stop:1249 length:288 start_codon:yes stop_codon:yes gene_type:complete
MKDKERGMIVKSIKKLNKDGMITPDNIWELISSISKEIRKERKLIWNYKINVEFEWQKPFKVGQVYDLTITWTPQGQNKARELTLPVENFEYKIQ